MAEPTILYLRALLSSERHFCSPALRAPELLIVGHFYVQTDNEQVAGAWAHDWCRLQSIEFKEYICLPAPIFREQIAEHEDEHIRAFELAMREGEAVVVSVVLGKVLL